MSYLRAGGDTSVGEERKAIFRLEGWIRRHIRKCYWIRWHSAEGRQRHLRELGLTGQQQGIATSSRGARRIAMSRPLHRALSIVELRKWGFLMPSDLAT